MCWLNEIFVESNVLVGSNISGSDYLSQMFVRSNILARSDVCWVECFLVQLFAG